MSKTSLVLLSFDGEYKRERGPFDSVEAAWQYANDLGSKWYFYPFVFVASESGKTIRETPRGLERFKGQRVATVAAIFARISKQPGAEGEGVDAYTERLTGWPQNEA